MIKLPKPLATEGVWYPNGTDKPGVVGDCYTAEQMLQYGHDRALEALEMAANRVSVWDKSFNTGGVFAASIRKQKETM